MFFKDIFSSFRFEDGTIPFLEIAALRHGFDALERLGGKGIRNAPFTTLGVSKEMMQETYFGVRCACPRKLMK